MNDEKLFAENAVLAFHEVLNVKMHSHPSPINCSYLPNEYISRIRPAFGSRIGGGMCGRFAASETPSCFAGAWTTPLLRHPGL